MSAMYPHVLGETATMALAYYGHSLARFGDGELRLALGEGKHIAQVQDPQLSIELKQILLDQSVPNFVCCIPNSMAPNGKPVMWGSTRYSAPRFVELYDKDASYGSSFVTRPDSAPWIDTPEYWTRCRKLWEGKHVVLVLGERGGSLTDLHHAASVKKIYGPERDAYARVNELETEIANAALGGATRKTVLLCLGPTATVLAYRLARAGAHALDVGHLGRFMPQKFLHKD